MGIANETCIHCFTHIPHNKYIFPIDCGQFIDIFFEKDDKTKDMLEKLYSDKNFVISIVENVILIKDTDILLKIEALKIFIKKTKEQIEVLPKIRKVVVSKNNGIQIYINLSTVEEFQKNVS